MLELAALGLLYQEPLNGYRLKQRLEQFMSSCISVNYGAIYPLLKRLESRGDITTQSEEPGQTGLSRKIYCITPQGRDRWLQEMLAHPHESWVNARSRFRIKFFFFSHLEPEIRQKLIEHRLLVCQLRLESQTAAPLADDFYQAASQHRAIALLRDEIEWLLQFRQPTQALEISAHTSQSTSSD